MHAVLVTSVCRSSTIGIIHGKTRLATKLLFWITIGCFTFGEGDVALLLLLLTQHINESLDSRHPLRDLLEKICKKNEEAIDSTRVKHLTLTWDMWSHTKATCIAHASSYRFMHSLDDNSTILSFTSCDSLPSSFISFKMSSFLRSSGSFCHKHHILTAVVANWCFHVKKACL